MVVLYLNPSGCSLVGRLKHLGFKSPLEASLGLYTVLAGGVVYLRLTT
jgi:hypothetical protein